MNGWVNNREAGDLGHHRTHYDVTVMFKCIRNCYILNNLSLAQLMSYEELFPEPVK